MHLTSSLKKQLYSKIEYIKIKRKIRHSKYIEKDLKNNYTRMPRYLNSRKQPKDCRSRAIIEKLR